MSDKRFPDISDYYQGALAEKEDQDWHKTKFHLRHLESVQRLLAERPEVKSILEIGCGPGLLASVLPLELTYLGVDLNETFLAKARERNPGRSRMFIRRDVRELPSLGAMMPRAKYDLVVSFAFLKHFGLHEWDEIASIVLNAAPLAVVELQVAQTEADNGTEFHHTFISQGRLQNVLTRANKRILWMRETFSEHRLETGRWQELTVACVPAD